MVARDGRKRTHDRANAGRPGGADALRAEEGDSLRRTLRDAPQTFVAMIVIVLLAVVLDVVWKRMRPAAPPQAFAGAGP